MTDWSIGEGEPDRQEGHEGPELHALGNAAHDQGRGEFPGGDGRCRARDRPLRRVAARCRDLAARVPEAELLRDLAESDRSDLIRSMKRHDLSSGEVLYRQGAAGESLFLLAEGLLTSFVSVAGDEGEAKVEQIESGRHFGEDSLLTGKSRASTVTAATDAVVFEIPKAPIMELAGRRGEFLAMLNRNVALSQERIHRSKRAASKRRKSASRRKKKKTSGVTKAIQTFFTDLFPSNETETSSG